MAKKKTNQVPVAVIIAVIVTIVIVAIILASLYFTVPVVRDKIDTILGFKKVENTNSNPQPSGGGGNNNPSLVTGDGDLAFHMLDIGQGDWLLIILPDGKEMVVDAGRKPGSSTVYNTGKAYMDQYITDGQIDYVVLTHSDQDHVEYMDEIFRDYQVSNVYMPALYATHSSVAEANIPASKTKILDDSGVDKNKCYITTQTYAKFYIAAFNEPNCNIFLNIEFNEDSNDATLDSHSLITSSDNTYSIAFFFESLTFYNNKKFDGDSHQINGISPTMIIEYNGKRIVLTGDANEENEPNMVDRMQKYYGGVIDCDVLKVAHHGSHEGSSNDYLAEVKCEYAMISCGTGNTYNHPRQAALNRLKAKGITGLYRTDLHGNIVCIIDKDGAITITPTNTNVSEEAIWKGADAA